MDRAAATDRRNLVDEGAQKAELRSPPTPLVQPKKIAVSAMQIDCKVFATQLVWGIVANGIF
jgi:hypothetical protein